MKKVLVFVVISLMINLVFRFSFVFSLENSDIIYLDYPKKVNFGGEFYVNLTLKDFPEDVYDVRISVVNDSLRLSRIWNGSYWQSSYYYIKYAINNSQKPDESFRLNITNCYNGIAKIEIKIRGSDGYIYSFYDYPIEVSGNCRIKKSVSSSLQNEKNENYNPGIMLKLYLEERAISSKEEFYIKIKVYNLEDREYDLKIFVYDKNEGKIISQVYNEEDWVSSDRYLGKFFRGPGNKTENIKLRIKEDFRNLSGVFEIIGRVRENGYSAYQKETVEKIIIEDPKLSEDYSPEDYYDRILETGSEKLTDEEVVHHIGPKTETIKTKKILYKSRNESVKNYSIFVFVVLVIIFVILLNTKETFDGKKNKSYVYF